MAATRPIIQHNEEVQAEITERRRKLREFAQEQFKNPDRADALCNIVQRSADLVSASKFVTDRPRALIDDLERVLVGEEDTLTLLRRGRGRGQGDYFAGNIKGANGFKPEFRDEYNQLQHAAAALIIGYRYGIEVNYYLADQERKRGEPQDALLYEAIFPVGRSLTEENYLSVSRRLRTVISQSPP